MGLTLTQTRGLQGSGKSHWAKAQQASDSTIVLVCRDDLRRMLHDGRWSKVNERQVVDIQNAIIADSLSRGRSVIVHDTGFGEENEIRLRGLASANNATYVLKDFTDVPLETCIARDLAREYSVGKDVIMKFYNKYLAPAPADPPAYDPSLPTCVIADVDGTVALKHDGRGPYEHDKCIDDLPNLPVIGLVQDLIRADEEVIYCSGREEKYRADTEKWIYRHIGPRDLPLLLFMRETGDRRNDATVKMELYERHIKGKWNIRFVLDDRQRVVDAWRALGLTVLQVADGKF